MNSKKKRQKMNFLKTIKELLEMFCKTKYFEKLKYFLKDTKKF